MWERGRDGFGGQGETSGINKDKTESILTTVEALQPMSTWCLPQPPRSDCTDTDGERSLLSVQHPAAAPTQGNSPNKVRCKCCFLATREPHKKLCLPVCLGTSSKELVQKVHVKISSLALMAFAIYRMKESFSSPCFFLALVQMLSWSVLLQTVYLLMCPFTFPTYKTSVTSQQKTGVGTQCGRTCSLCFEEQTSLGGSGEAAHAAESKRCSVWKQWASTSLSRGTQPPPCHRADQIVCSCLTRVNSKRGAGWESLLPREALFASRKCKKFPHRGRYRKAISREATKKFLSPLQIVTNH